MEYFVYKWLHILSSTLLFGTGIGTAWYLLFAAISRDTRVIAAVTRMVVVADWLFTGATMIAQPATGFYLIHLAGYPLHSRWIMWSLGLYLLALCCWLPVVWLQIRLRDLSALAAAMGRQLPRQFWRYFTGWVILGAPTFFALLAVFYLMLAKPV